MSEEEEEEINGRKNIMYINCKQVESVEEACDFWI